MKLRHDDTGAINLAMLLWLYVPTIVFVAILVGEEGIPISAVRFLTRLMVFVGAGVAAALLLNVLPFLNVDVPMAGVGAGLAGVVHFLNEVFTSSMPDMPWPVLAVIVTPPVVLIGLYAFSMVRGN
jgi:hypothetical protein